ncbi:MAG TPA: lysophospholipid acyltransferase family protein [Terriglobia bacterium]|nr:lysophospholipid acyltransferase family protein [Terriglobia bacterium]
MIRAIFVTLVTFLYILVIGIPFLIHAWLTGNPETLYRVGVRGARMALWLAGIRIEVCGRENVPRGRAAIYMPNHQSNVDPAAVITVLPRVAVMAKREFFRVPVLGRGMILCGFIPVERKNRERAIAAVERAVSALRAGTSFLGYPEGTRSPDGRLQAFKKGVFVMAIKSGALVVPMSVSGASKIMPKGEPVIRPGRIRITFQQPIDAGNYTMERRGELIQRTHDAIRKGLTPEEWPTEDAKDAFES